MLKIVAQPSDVRAVICLGQVAVHLLAIYFDSRAERPVSDHRQFLEDFWQLMVSVRNAKGDEPSVQ